MSAGAVANGRAGFAASVPALQFLQGEALRPDLFEEATAPGRGVMRPATGAAGGGLAGTLGIIFLSAFIFVTLVAWLEVVRAYIDARVVNEVIYETARARVYYALAVTAIAASGLLLMFAIWRHRRARRCPGA